MLKNNMIPPHCGIKTKINHTFPNDLQERRVFIASKPTPWKRPHNGVRRALLNNFSAAGGNTALLLEDAPIEILDKSHDRRSNHVVAVSAKCAASLQGNVSALLSFLNNIRPDELPHMSWTTTARRIHHPHRIMVYGDDIEKIKANLRQALEAKEGLTRPKSAPKVIFAFTGQGTAYPGMARQLFEELSSFRSDINRFDLTARNLGFPSFKAFFTASGGDISEYTPLALQLAIVCLEMALARLWTSWGILPHAAVGHSLGEYAALNVAGVISETDTIYLVGKRAQLLQEHCLPGTHSMLAIRACLAEVERTLSGKKYEIACINSPEDVVISGSGEEIRDAQQLLAASNFKTSVLNIPYAFHSAQVDPILSGLEQAAQGVSFHSPVIPVLSPLRANLVRGEGVFGPNYLSQHCRKPVDILGAVRAAQESGVITEKTIIIEIGPQPVVSAMIKATVPQVQALPSLRRKTDTWEVVAQTISTLYTTGADVLWREYHRDFKSSQRVLQLPAYRWDLKEYWMQYVNDWSLRKGDPPLVQHVLSQEAARTKPTLARLESTTIHTIVEETVHEGQGTITVESDISRPDLNPMVQGHKVNGVPLCTPVRKSLCLVIELVSADCAMHSPYMPTSRFLLENIYEIATGLRWGIKALLSLTWSSKKLLSPRLTDRNSFERLWSYIEIRNPPCAAS
jgi:acyl transferase domain-containing protein